MSIRRAYVILDRTPEGSAREFNRVAGEIFSRGLDAAFASADASADVVREAYFCQDAKTTKHHQVVLMADSMSDFDDFFKDANNKRDCFRKSIALVKKQTTAGTLSKPITPDKFLETLPAFAVISIK